MAAAPNAAVQLLGRFLVAEEELPAAQRQLLYDDFTTSDIRDAPSFSRALSRLAADYAYLKAEALHASSAVL